MPHAAAPLLVDILADASGKFHGLALLSHALSLRMYVSPFQRLSLSAQGPAAVTID